MDQFLADDLGLLRVLPILDKCTLLRALDLTQVQVGADLGDFVGPWVHKAARLVLNHHLGCYVTDLTMLSHYHVVLAELGDRSSTSDVLSGEGDKFGAFLDT